MKRLLALILVCVTFIFMLSSCANIDVKKLEAEAALKLLEAPYIINVEMNINGSDDGADDSMGSSMSMNIDGKNFKMTAGSDSMGIDCTFADNTLYMEMMGSKLKAEMSAEEVEEFIGTDVSGISKMSIDTFSTVKTKREDSGKITISCKGLNGESNELIDSLIEDIGDIGEGDEAVTLDKEKFEYVAVISEDGRYESMSITIVMTTEIDEESLTITATVNVTFDYENAVEVNVPADADEYYDIGDIEGIFG